MRRDHTLSRRVLAASSSALALCLVFLLSRDAQATNTAGWLYQGKIKGAKLNAVRQIVSILKPISEVRSTGTFTFNTRGKRWFRASITGANSYTIEEFGPRHNRRFVIDKDAGLGPVWVSPRNGRGGRSYQPGAYIKITGEKYNDWTKVPIAVPAKSQNPLQMWRLFAELPAAK